MSSVEQHDIQKMGETPMTSKDELRLLRLQVGHQLHDYGVRGQDNDYLTDYILNLLEGEKLKAILDGEERGYKKGFDEAKAQLNQLLIKERLVRGIYELERLEYIPQMHGDWQKVIDDRITKLESELAFLENQLGEKS